MDFFKNIILRTETLTNQPKFEESKNNLHIAFGIDANFARGMGVCITSIILNNPEEKLVFHIFTDGINKEDIDRLKLLDKYGNVKIKIYYIDKNAFKNFPINHAWSCAIYYRLIMGKILYGIVDKVLYLDADVLCINSLKELSNKNIGDNIALAVSEKFIDFESTKLRLSIKGEKYFNSGVLYIDINKWSNERIAERAIALLNTQSKKYICFDQDVLNVILDGKTYFEDEKWNYIYDLRVMNDDLPEGVALIHFAGEKPWKRWNEHHFMVRCYYEYMKKSPWYDTPLIEPRTYKEKKNMAKSYRKRGMYIQALKYYWEYLKQRRKGKNNFKR